MKEIRIEALSDILENLGIVLSQEQIKQIEEDFSHHIDMEREMESYSYVGYREECSKCKNLEHELKEIKKENEVFRNSVKVRRNANHVWIENASVMYE